MYMAYALMNIFFYSATQDSGTQCMLLAGPMEEEEEEELDEELEDVQAANRDPDYEPDSDDNDDDDCYTYGDESDM